MRCLAWISIPNTITIAPLFTAAIRVTAKCGGTFRTTCSHMQSTIYVAFIYPNWNSNILVLPLCKNWYIKSYFNIIFKYLWKVCIPFFSSQSIPFQKQSPLHHPLPQLPCSQSVVGHWWQVGAKCCPQVTAPSIG